MHSLIDTAGCQRLPKSFTGGYLTSNHCLSPLIRALFISCCPLNLSSPRLTFYGGVGEIGGNKILLEDRGTSIFFDFGAGFADGVDYYSAGIQPRNVNGLGDYFEFGLMPKIEGLYSEEALENTEIKYSKPEIDAIVLSHYHSDHAGRIHFVDPEIPIYCGETTSLFHEAYSSAGGSMLRRSQTCYF